MYTYESLIPHQSAPEPMNYCATPTKGANSNEGVFLPPFSNELYAHTPQFVCKTPQKVTDYGEPNKECPFLITEDVNVSCDTASSSPRSLEEPAAPQTLLESLHIGKTLGVGASCKVKLARDNEGNRYAIKILKQNKQLKSFIEAEVETLRTINHPHIVNLIESGEGLKGESMTPFQYILLELVNGGCLFDYVAHAGRFEEKYARHYFNQLLSGLNHIHASGFAHRDIKLENLMLDDQFNLKIADFGFADIIQGRDCSGKLEGKMGTLGYMAPEIHLGEAYSGQSVDLFAAGIILFVLLTRRVPFTRAHPSDPHYYLLVTNPEKFWASHAEAEDGADIYTQEFKDLFEKMLSFDADLRPNYDEIMCHPWMMGEVPSEQEIAQEFAQRRMVVKSHEN